MHEILSSLLTNCIGSAENLEELDRQPYDFINKLSKEYKKIIAFTTFAEPVTSSLVSSTLPSGPGDLKMIPGIALWLSLLL